MNPNDTSNSMTPAPSVRIHNQPRAWLAAVSPLLRHVNTRTLAFLMFVGFALLHTTHGKDAETKAGDSDPLLTRAVRPGKLEDLIELAQGYLKVYSATDELKEGAARYFPHSPYAIYTLDGKLFKNVKNRRSTDDEIPELVRLPVGSYVVKARSQRGGNVGIVVIIKEDQETVLDLDLWEIRT